MKRPYLANRGPLTTGVPLREPRPSSNSLPSPFGMYGLSAAAPIAGAGGAGSGSGSGSGDGTGSGVGSGNGSNSGPLPDWTGAWPGGVWPQSQPPPAPPQDTDVIWNEELGEWGRVTVDPETGDVGWEHIPQGAGEGGGGGNEGEPRPWEQFGFGGAIYGYPGVYTGDPSEERDYFDLARNVGGLFGIGGDAPFNFENGIPVVSSLYNLATGLQEQDNEQQLRQAQAMQWNTQQEKALNDFLAAAESVDPAMFDGTIASAEQILGGPIPEIAVLEDPWKIVNGDVSLNKFHYSDDFQPLTGYTPGFDQDIIDTYGQSGHYDYETGGAISDELAARNVHLENALNSSGFGALEHLLKMYK